jgi:hypothetical protein
MSHRVRFTVQLLKRMRLRKIDRAKPVLSNAEGQPSRQNPKSEYRNPRQIQPNFNPENPKHRIRRRFVWNFIYFSHLKLFRISDFVFRIYSRNACRKVGQIYSKGKVFRYRFSRGGLQQRHPIAATTQRSAVDRVRPQQLFLGHLCFYANSREGVML